MIYVGPSGWTHPRLGDLWPKRRGSVFDPLTFLARHFSCVEIDVTAHAIPRKAHVLRWKAAFDEARGGRLVVRLPEALTDFTRSQQDRDADLEATASALGPLIGREGLGALVLTLGPEVLHGAAELRVLGGIARALRGAPLALEANHASWYDSTALDAVGGAGWSLAHLEPADRWDAPPREHRPTGPVAMIRLQAPGRPPAATVERIVQRARQLEQQVGQALVVACMPFTMDTPAVRLAASVEIGHAVGGGQPVPAWPELVETHPLLKPMTSVDDAAHG